MTINWQATRNAVKAALGSTVDPMRATGKSLIPPLEKYGAIYDSHWPPGVETVQIESNAHSSWRTSITDLNELAAQVDGLPVVVVGPDADDQAVVTATRTRLQKILSSSQYAGNPLLPLISAAAKAPMVAPQRYISQYYAGPHIATGGVLLSGYGQMEAALLAAVAQAEAWLEAL